MGAEAGDSVPLLYRAFPGCVGWEGPLPAPRPALWAWLWRCPSPASGRGVGHLAA
jgi:hypothetical protein